MRRRPTSYRNGNICFLSSSHVSLTSPVSPSLSGIYYTNLPIYLFTGESLLHNAVIMGADALANTMRIGTWLYTLDLRVY